MVQIKHILLKTGSLSADTWTKITKTIPGNSNLQFDNDNNVGLTVNIAPFWGTDYTDAGVSLNAWAAYASGTRAPNYTSTWYTTNDATFEITGVQLEVGSVATDFEHRSFGQELALCQRYCCIFSDSGGYGLYIDIDAPNVLSVSTSLPVEMRVEPTITMTGSGGTNNTGFVYNNLSGDPILTAVGKYTINVHKSVSSAGRSYIYLTGTGELTMDAEL